MKVVILADTHGNATALKAVLDDAGNIDALWCAGDIVGYGPDPAGCIDIVRAIPHVCIAGNHDVGVAGNVGVVANVDGAGIYGKPAGNPSGNPDSDSKNGVMENVGFTDNTGNAASDGFVTRVNAGSFNPDARIARDWTRSVLDDEDLLFLAKLPIMAEPVPDVLLAHGAPVAGLPISIAGGPGVRAAQDAQSDEQDSGLLAVDEIDSNPASPNELDLAEKTLSKKSNLGMPAVADSGLETADSDGSSSDSSKTNEYAFGIWEYITSSWQAEEIFALSRYGLPQSLIIVGHTHVPIAFVKEDGADVEYVPLEHGDIIELDFTSFRYFLNPGSVGQPRDGDPKASYMLYDTEANVIEYRRVEYDVVEVVERIDSTGLPHSLGARLGIGL